MDDEAVTLILFCENKFCVYFWHLPNLTPVELKLSYELFLNFSNAHKAKKIQWRWQIECPKISQPYLYHMFHTVSIIGPCWSLTSGNQLCCPNLKSACLPHTIFQLKYLGLAVMGPSFFHGLLCSPAHCPFHTQLPPQLHFRLISRTCRLVSSLRAEASRGMTNSSASDELKL